MEVAVSMAEKVMDLLFGVAIKNIGYMWNCSENVKTFKEEVEKLTALKATLEQRIRVAKDKGEDPGKDLENWMENANVKISEATSFITEEAESKKTCCNVRFCVNLGTLHHYGRRATKETSSLQQLKSEGEPFKNCIFNPLPDPGVLDLYQQKNLENINTQKSSVKRIIEAMKGLQIVGIVGLGGVGKTTIAKEVAAEMKNQFDHIEFIAISQTIDAKKIKEDVQVAARKINNGEKVLIILDDVWDELKLDEVGIPCGSDYPNCKILLTSRQKDVCESMNAQKIISVDPLPKEEAWTLFEGVVGMSKWDERLKPVALKIVHECGGLPLFILAVGKGLRNKDINTWEAALDRLKDPAEEDAPFKRKGIMQLKLSYDYLESEVAKSCFLLCSMFPEDRAIGFNKLACYAFGLRIFNKLDISLQEAKHRLQVAVDTLKSSFLLLPEGKYDDEKEELFKMHDLVRDMAILITSKGDDMFWVESGQGLTEWKPKKHFEKYTKISLMNNIIRKLPDHEFHFPHLDTFLIQNNYHLSTVPDEFFRGMEKLKVLDMSENKISSLPRSLKQLSELTMLDLSDNESLCEISILGELTCLEILNLSLTGITNIPEEIGQLTKLRLLNVFYTQLSYVTPGVISKLIRLEELSLMLTDDGNSEIFEELRELKSLKILNLESRNLRHIPADFHYEALKEFNITEERPYVRGSYKGLLKISELNFSFSMPMMKLIQLSDYLFFNEINDLDNIVPSLYRERPDELKCIELWECKNVTRLVKTCELKTNGGKFFSKLKEIILSDLDRLEVLCESSHHPYISFCNLAEINILRCSSLLELFPESVARLLVNLRNIWIQDCKSLVVVISSTSGSELDTVVFPKLNSIKLLKLPKLVSFYSGHSTIRYPSLDSVLVTGCGSVTRWSYGENDIPNIKFEYDGQQYNDINDIIKAWPKPQPFSWPSPAPVGEGVGEVLAASASAFQMQPGPSVNR